MVRETGLIRTNARDHTGLILGAVVLATVPVVIVVVITFFARVQLAIATGDFTYTG